MGTENKSAFSEREQATILAALRFYQARGIGDPIHLPEEFYDIATNGESFPELGDEEIDDLCERINMQSS